MSRMKVLAFALFIAGQAASQDASKLFPYAVPQDGPSSPKMQAQCKFPDGKTITVDYSTRHVKDRAPMLGEVWKTVFDDGMVFVTDASLVTANGISVPAGDYTIAPLIEFRGRTLFVKKHTGGESRVPMSVSNLTRPAENSGILFERTGGSCMMKVNSKNSQTQFFVEFTESNADLPAAN